jgi:hypothetical protein
MTGWRSAAELRDIADPAWTGITAQIARSPVEVDVVGADETARAAALEALQVTTRSPLGALVSECGVLRVDHGWLCILGAGAEGTLSPSQATELLAKGEDRFLVAAVDVLGGYFAINGGSLPCEPGEIAYWGPDTLAWAALGMGHGDFVTAMIGGAVTDFYEALRWPGWQDEVGALPLSYGLSIYPFPFTREGHDIAKATRRPAPLTELFDLYANLASQLADLPDGSSFRVRGDE